MAEDFLKYLTFEVASQLYAISIDKVREIITGCDSITTVPGFPHFARGIIHLRGNVVPITDLRRRFRIEGDVSGEGCIIVTECEGAHTELVGFAADKVNAVLDFEASEIKQPPTLIRGADYINGIIKVKGQIILILDPILLLSEGARAEIEKALSEGSGSL